MAEVKKGLYKHFKGSRVMVSHVAKHTETGDEVVVYQHLDADGASEAGAQWVRPLAMFLEYVEKPEHNYKGPRFAYVGEK